MTDLPTTIATKLVRGYLLRRETALTEIVDTVPVFSKRYCAAVDELEEVSDLLGRNDEED